jgi:phosphoglycolate phosphatase
MRSKANWRVLANEDAPVKKLAVFDFDGTLADTLADAAKCYNLALESLGFQQHPISSYVGFFGGTVLDIAERVLPKKARTQHNIEALAELYRAVYRQSDNSCTKPYPGVQHLLSNLSTNGIHIGISTNKVQSIVEPLARMLFPNTAFIGIEGFEAGKSAKPQPDSVNRLMHMADVSTLETVYIGDGMTDVLTAQNAGVDCLIVTWGQGSQEVYDHSYVAEVIDNAEAILNYMLRH